MTNEQWQKIGRYEESLRLRYITVPTEIEIDDMLALIVAARRCAVLEEALKKITLSPIAMIHDDSTSSLCECCEAMQNKARAAVAPLGEPGGQA